MCTPARLTGSNEGTHGGVGIGPPRRAAVAGAVLLALGMAEPLLFQVRNHPNQIIYFTPLMGGPQAAFARYDMDYWGNSVLQAVEWTDRVARESGVPIIVSGNPIQAVDANAARFKTLQVVARADLVYHLDIRQRLGAVRGHAVRRDRADHLLHDREDRADRDFALGCGPNPGIQASPSPSKAPCFRPASTTTAIPPRSSSA